MNNTKIDSEDAFRDKLNNAVVFNDNHEYNLRVQQKKQNTKNMSVTDEINILKNDILFLKLEIAKLTKQANNGTNNRL